MQNMKSKYELSDEWKHAFVNMVKYMVTNEWGQNQNRKEIYRWMSNGTGIPESVLRSLLDNEKLFDKSYLAWSVDNPFTIKRIKEDRTR